MITRFAPSPTGPLHLGHAYSAILAHDMARAARGRFLVRMEDIDRHRARPEWETRILDDLNWLGLNWDGPVMRQSTRGVAYANALARLDAMGVIYRCTCRRRDIAEAARAPQEGTEQPIGPDGIVYPGTCRLAGHEGNDVSLRLNMARALSLLDRVLSFQETAADLAGTISHNAQTMVTGIGDVVLARRDMGTSYHLSVVVDDATQQITDVTRGRDLFEATAIHLVLQGLLDFKVPRYHHHRLIRDENGKRLAKRDDARALATYRAEGAHPRDIRKMVGL